MAPTANPTFFSVLQDVLGDYAGSTPTQTLMQTKYGNENTYDLAAHEGIRLAGERDVPTVERIRFKNDDKPPQAATPSLSLANAERIS